ncbi:hypothetical protein BH11ACT3_BH11ACT3_16120 [soil metagenome]
MTDLAKRVIVDPQPESTATPPRRKGLLHHIGVALSVLLLLFVALVALAVIVVPIASHSTPYTVLTSSMEPVYPPGTLVVVKPLETADIHLGDVITYQLKSGKKDVVTHRVIAVNQTPGEDTTFITKGDNNDVADANPVLPVQVRGAVWYAVPYVGWVNNVINGDARAIAIPIVAVLLFGYAGYMFTGSLVASARKRRAKASEVTESELKDLLAEEAAKTRS